MEIIKAKKRKLVRNYNIFKISNFNIKFSVSEIIDVKNVKDIKKHLNNHGVDLNG